MPSRLVTRLSSLAALLRTRKAVALLVLSVLALILLQRHLSEPSHENLAASKWLELASTNQTLLPEATIAFRAMGSAGAEFLGQELLREPSSFAYWLLAHHQSIPGSLRSLLLKPHRPPDGDTILQLLNALGTNARPAIPSLLSRLEKGEFSRSPETIIPLSMLPTNTPFNFHATFAGTMQTQVVVTAPGLVITNLLIHVRNNSPALPLAAFQILTNNAVEDPRFIQLLLSSGQHLSLYGLYRDSPAIKAAATKSIPLLAETLKWNDSSRRVAAVCLLGQALPESKAAHEQLIRALEDKDVMVFRSALRLLQNSTNDLDRIMPLCARAFLRYPGHHLMIDHGMYYSFQNFARHGQPVIAELQKILDRAAPLEQQIILDYLGQLGTSETVDMTQLTAYTRSSEPRVRSAAFSAIGKLTADQQSTMHGQIQRLVANPDDWSALLKISEYGPQASSAVPVLTEVLKSRNERVVAKAAETLGKIGPAAKDALPQLEKLRTHPHLLVREPVEDAIRQISAPANAKGAE